MNLHTIDEGDQQQQQLCDDDEDDTRTCVTTDEEEEDEHDENADRRRTIDATTDATVAAAAATATFDATMQEQYTMMSRMTLELVRDLTTVKPHDDVITQYGTGRLLTKKSTAGRSSSNSGSSSMQIQLPFGTLYYRQAPEMLHKALTPHEYEHALDHLEQVRKLGFTAQCQKWNVPLIEEVCVPCLFNKPYTTSTTTTTNNENKATAAIAKKTKRSWFSRASRSSGGTSSPSSSLDINSDANSNRRVQVALEKDAISGKIHKKKKTTKTKFCDVCGNPVCSKHIIPTPGGQQFRMCVDCQFDLTQMFTDTNNSTRKININTNNNSSRKSRLNRNLLELDHLPQLTQTLDRLLYYYTRMVVHLTFAVPNLRELADRLTSKQRSDSKIRLGTGGLSFVGAAWGGAGAAAMITPAGPALLIAAVATSATSAAIQGTHMGYNATNLNQKEAHQVADRILGWHGLCLGILEALEQVRQVLLQELLALAIVEDDAETHPQHVNHENDADHIQQQLRRREKNAIILQQVLNSRSSHNTGTNTSTKSTTDQSVEVLNMLASGTYHTTRHGLTGVVR